MLVFIVFNYILQATTLGAVAILGVKPDTALIFVVSYGILRGDMEGAVFGFATGLMHDLFGGYVIGLYAMLYMLVGYVSGKPFKDFFHNNYFLPFFVVVIATVCFQFLFYCCAVLFTATTDIFYYSRTIILPKTIYTASIAIPLYSLMFAINTRIERYEKNRRNLFKEKAAL